MITLQFDMKKFDSGWITRIGIVIVAAVLVEVISVVQYQRLRSMMGEEVNLRSKVVLGAMVHEIEHMLELTEITLAENKWDIMRHLSNPDSLFPVMTRLIDDNPNVVGGCLAFLPYYYPSKGRLFEPYARKLADGTIVTEQLASPEHDYTQNGEFIWAMEHLIPFWTDPYLYGTDSLSYATYSAPIYDNEGRLAAWCGLDIDLSWLGDTLNSHQPFASSFGLLLTIEGDLVAGPSPAQIPREEVFEVVDIVNGRLSASDFPGLVIRKTQLDKEPYWQLIQVHKTEEIYRRMTQMRHQHILFMLLGLAILSFMINRYARNERKLREASAEQARIGGELEVARDIQQQMLPKVFPSYIYGTQEPALEVGGDLYDFYIRDGKLFFCIGDVSGKGVPSAMLMSMIHSLFRVVSRKEENPSQILWTLNNQLCDGDDNNMFVTCFVGCLDLYTGKLNYANAGHDKPFLLTTSASILPVRANLPLGVYPMTEFELQSMTLSPGTTLFLYTDGLTEAKNKEHKALGRERVLQVLEACLAKGTDTPEDLVGALSAEVHSFAGGRSQSDDLTLLCIRYQPGDNLRKQITLGNNTEEVAALSDFVKDFLGQIEMERRVAAGLRLALEETVVNVMNYAYPAGEHGEVTVYADSNYKEVRFTVVDAGFPFDPTAVLSADTTLDVQNRPIGGLGIHLTRKMVDSISYSRKHGFNVLTLTKSIS